jgi:hypothetical protein
LAEAIVRTSAAISALTKAGPVLAEAAALPAQDGIGRDNDEHPPPAGPDSGQAGPEQAVGRAEPRAGGCSLVDGELLAQGQVLERELAMAAEEEGEEPEQVKYEGDHGRRLWPDGAGESIICPAAHVMAKDSPNFGPR